MRNLFLVSVALGILVAPGCAVTNATLKSDDGRTVVRSIQDVNAARTIKARMTRAHGFDLGGVDVEVREGVALLSGRAPRPEDRIEAERIAWSAPEVEHIGNEIRIGDKQKTFRNIKDGVLEKTVRTRLIAAGDVTARDLNIETHEGIVYMLGMVDSEEERTRAAGIAATTRGVAEVVSYMKVRGEETPPAFKGTVASAPTSPNYGSPVASPVYEVPEEVVGRAPVVPAEPVLRDPVSGDRLPSGTAVDPYAGDSFIMPPAERSEYKDENGAPFYIDPDSGNRIPVTYKTLRPRG